MDPQDVDALIQGRLLRYVDAAEIASLRVALEPSVARQRPVDLIEVHAHLILGVTAALIPNLRRDSYLVIVG